jgi:branched-chain amino acid transport system ATP-binding protein
VSALLELDTLQVKYGGVTAVRDVSMSVSPGQVLAILGANGAGKTSTLRAITGLVPAAAGTVTFDGADVTGVAPERLAHLGIAHVPAGRGIFGSLSVADNLRLGLYGAATDRSTAGRQRLDEMLETFPILAEKRSQPAGQLSGGQQQQLAIARALVQAPRLLLLDEMSMGLAPTVVADLFGIVGGLRDRGIAIIMVEQFVGQALKVADSVLVLEQGRVVAAGKPSDLSDDDVAAAYLGGSEAHKAVHIPPPPATARETIQIDVPGRDIRDLERLAAANATTVSTLLQGSIDILLAERT